MPSPDTAARPAPPSPPAPPYGPPGRSQSLADLLRVPSTVSAPYTRESLGCTRTTWEALLRDGAMVEVRGGFAVGPGTALTPALRARSLADDVPRDVVVGRATAAWVHSGTGDPERVCVLYAPGGYRPRDARRLEIAQASVRTWEREVLDVPGGPVVVTSLVRTAMDVATWCTAEQATSMLAALVGVGLEVDEALRRLDLVASWRGAERARTRLLEVRRRGQTLASTPALDPVMR